MENIFSYYYSHSKQLNIFSLFPMKTKDFSEKNAMSSWSLKPGLNTMIGKKVTSGSNSIIIEDVLHI